MKNLRKGVMVLLATLVMGLIAVGGVAPQVQAAKMKVSSQPDKPYYSAYKKTKKVTMKVKTTEGTAKITIKRSKIESDIKKLASAMKKGLSSDPKATFTYKSTDKKYVAKLVINKKSGTFTATMDGEEIFSKSFTYSKWKKNVYVLKSATGSTKYTLKLTSTSKKKFFRLYNGKTVKTSKTLARFGTTKNKWVFVKSVLPYFAISGTPTYSK